MTVTSFGTLDDGTDVPLITLTGGGLSLGIIGLGAAIRSLDFDDGRGPRPMVLGLQTLDDCVWHSPNMGVIAGRYANRIGGARFPLDGREVVLVSNLPGGHHLHGGPAGFSKRAWTLGRHGPDFATLVLVSEDGDQGFPGRVEASCRYSLPADGTVRIELTAVTDAPTVLNLAAHSYFNLDGTDTILDHLVEIAADAYTPVDEGRIPTGEIAPVEGTPYDFRKLRKVGLDIDGKRFAYDTNYVIANEKTATPRLVGRVVGPQTGTELQVHSTEIGLQFYDGAFVGVPVPGIGGRRFGANSGLCLEPQFFPDTPNKPQFGSAVLRPGETYRQVTEYRFRRM